MTQPDENKASPATLFAAIAKAQADCKAVEKSSSNDHHRYKYASAESVIEASTAAMGPHGLALICTNITPDAENRMLSVDYILTHSSGVSMALGPYKISIHAAQGRPMDKAISTAATYLQAYALRGILNIPRVEEGAERDSIDDQLIQNYKTAEHKQKQKTERSYASLWAASASFFAAAKVERPRSKEGGVIFKKWISFMAHGPGKVYPIDMADQLVAIEIAKVKLAEWKKEEDGDGEHTCEDFAAQLVGAAQ